MTVGSTGQAARGARWAPAATAVAVVVLVALVAAVLGTRGGDSAAGPPPLRLGAGAAAEQAVVAGSALAGPYRLAGDLPADGPQRGRVHRLPAGPADEDDVRRLADALGIEGEPVREGERWTVRDTTSGTTLDVSGEAGQPWWSGPAVVDPGPAAPMPVEPVPGTETGGSSPSCPAPLDGTVAQCHVGASAPPPATPAVDAVAEQEALDVVRPLLAGLGLTGADVRTEAYGEARGVLAAPRVDGLPTQGWETRFEIGADGALLSASGMLGRPVAGEEYPLVDARQAFALLDAQPQPDVAPPCPPGAPCGPVEQVVTGARPGLQLQVDESGQLLVPAWLFSVLDTPYEVGQVAVDPAHLEPPRSTEIPTEPVEPVPPPPALEGRTTFAFDRAARGTEPAEVVVGYGDSGSCPRTSVTPLVEESDEVVTVTLEADAMAPDTVCTTDYVGVDLTVPLSAPLGDRVLIDGTTGRRHELP